MNLQKQFKTAQKYRDNGRVQDALVLYKKARKEFLEENDLKNASECYHMIGVAYYQIKKFDEANKYLRLSLREFSQRDDVESVGFVFRDLGIVARSEKKYEKAKKYLVASINNLKKARNIGHEGMSHVKLGRVFADVGKFDKAFKEIEKGMKLLGKSKEKFFLSSAYLDHAEVDAQKSLTLLNEFADKDEFEKRRKEINKILEN